MVLRSVWLALHLKWRWMVDGAIAAEHNWNQWRYHTSTFEINGLHGNTSVFGPSQNVPSLCSLAVTDVLNVSSRVTGSRQPLCDWLSVLLYNRAALAPLCNYHLVQPFTSMVRSSLSPVVLCTHSKSAFSPSVCLIHCDFIALSQLLLPNHPYSLSLSLSLSLPP